MNENSNSHSTGSWVSLNKQRLREDEKKMFSSKGMKKTSKPMGYSTLNHSHRDNEFLDNSSTPKLASRNNQDSFK